MYRFFSVASLCLLSVLAKAQTDSSLEQRVQAIVAARPAHIGVSVLTPDGKELFTINGKDHFPTQSVYKFPLAVFILHKVDQKELSMDQKFYIKPSMLADGTWSPMRDDHRGKSFYITLREILSYTVGKSDNNGCDFLLKQIGGPANLASFIHSLGIFDVSFAATEAQMHASWDVQYTNWATPSAATKLLQIVFDGTVLSKESRDFLWSAMNGSVKNDRIGALLPSGTTVVHKSGTSGTNDQHITAAWNDIGWVVLPNGKRFAVAVFVSDSKDDDAANNRTIAEISKAAWDYFLTH